MATSDKNIHRALRALETAWENAEPTSVYSVPDANYIAKLTDMEIGFSRNGRLQVVSTFEIADGKMSGRAVKKFDGIDTDIGISFFKGYCEVLGLEYPEDIDELPDTLRTFVEEFDALVNISVKTKDDYQNVNVKGLSDYEVDEETEKEEEEEEEEKDSDDDDEDTEEKIEESKSKKKVVPKKKKGRR